jgi:cytoskeleton-associated protein 5
LNIYNYFREFGSNVLNIKPLLKKLQFILEDRDKTVREEAKLLAIEIYSWIGPIPLKVNLPNLKPSQVKINNHILQVNI